MIKWQQGGSTGSLNRWVRREVREQLRSNPTARRARLPITHRLLRRFFSIGRFSRFVSIYFAIAILVLAAEFVAVLLVPSWLPRWTASGPPPAADIKTLLLNISSYYISAQVGVLGVISIALALVTIIAQRESSSSDVQLYYHESLAFEIVASCIALIVVLCVQLVWPLHFLLHKLGGGTELQAFKLLLLGIHTLWLVLNLVALSHFVTVTFRFVQQTAREDLRERYTVNIIHPVAMTSRLREQLYSLAGSELLEEGDDESERKERPRLMFGFDLGESASRELETYFRRPSELHDVRVIWVRWVGKRWAARCEAEKEPSSASRFGRDQALLMFTPRIGQRLSGQITWCRRRGGVSLTPFELFVLRYAFRFRRQRDET